MKEIPIELRRARKGGGIQVKDGGVVWRWESDILLFYASIKNTIQGKLLSINIYETKKNYHKDNRIEECVYKPDIRYFPERLAGASSALSDSNVKLSCLN